MHQFVSLNSRICGTADARVSAISAAALYGRGIFTTVALAEGKPLLWASHWTRLQDHGARIGLEITAFNKEKAADALDELIHVNGVGNGVARLTFFDESSGGLWPFHTAPGTSLLIMTRDPRPAPDGMRLTVSPYQINSTSPLAGVKSSNYLENLLALEEAKSRGFDEAVRLNERGEVTSACIANIFWEKDGQIFTPSLRTGCLAGTTRGELVARGAVEVTAEIDAIVNADSLMLTSAGLGRLYATEFKMPPQP